MLGVSKMSIEEDISYQTGLVAFIDILGFKEIVKKSERNPRLLKIIYDSLVFLKKESYLKNGSFS